jgi:hypothetical protein
VLGIKAANAEGVSVLRSIDRLGAQTTAIPGELLPMALIALTRIV